MYYRELDRRDVIPFQVLQATIEAQLRPRQKPFWDPLPGDPNTFFIKVWTYFQGCCSNDGTLIGAAGVFLNPADVAKDALIMDLSPDTTAEVSRCMVLSPFRGRGIALKMVDALALRAQVENKTDLIMAVHPYDNGMNRIAQKLKMKVEVNASGRPKPRLYYRLKL